MAVRVEGCSTLLHANPTNGPNHEAKQVASSKQLPTYQRGTDNAEKHEPNKIRPEDYGMSIANDQSIAASAK